MQRQKDVATRSTSTDPDIARPVPGIYAWYVVLVLVVVNALAYVDRQSMSFLIAPMQADLKLSETQAGFLLGPAFMLLYLPLGAPLGWLADRASRRGLLVAGVTIWSFSTCALGISHSYSLLLAARAGVGLGEASIIPAAFSLIPAYFPPRFIGRAVGLVSVGISLGASFALFGGGLFLNWIQRGGTRYWPLVADEAAWRTVFIVFGAAGVVVVALLLTVHEPARIMGPVRVSSIPIQGLIALLRARWRPIALVLGPYVTALYIQYAVGAWLPTLVSRNLHMPIGDAAYDYGIILLSASPVSVIVSGLLADHFHAHSSIGRFMMAVIGAPLFVIAILLMVFGTHISIIMAGMAIMTIAGAIVSTTVYAAIQDIVPRMFAGRMLGFYAVVANFFGLGVGPLLVGSITQHFFHDPAKLGWSILAASIPALAIGLACCWFGRGSFQTLRREAMAANEYVHPDRA